MKIKKHIFILLFSTLIHLSINAQISALNLLQDTTYICAGDSFLLKFPDDQFSKTATYNWQTPKSIIVHSKQLYIKHQGLHIIKIFDERKIVTDTTYLEVIDKPRIKIRDTIICGNPIIIPLKNNKYKYICSNGEISNRQIKIEKPGIYWIKIDNKGCYAIDTFKVKSVNFAVPNFGKELLICENDYSKTLSVKAPPETELYWNTGANTPNISINKEGTYWIKSISKNCGIKTDSVIVKYKNCDCDIYIPNSFTPNDDDRNDLFYPVFQCEYSYYLITIMDRWGNTVYTSNNINGKWDGKFKNNLCPDDVYVYHIEAIQKNSDKKIIRNGHISLFR